MQQQMAQQVLTQFQEHPDAWTRVPDILERSAFPQAKVRAYFMIGACLGVNLLRWDTVHWLADSRKGDHYAVEVAARWSTAR
jgi:hypothetical protein